jgi:hypothetical protein
MATSRHSTAPLTQRPAWTALREHHGKIRDVHLRTPFADDPTRGELGKALAMRIVPELRAPDDTNLTHDSSTNALIRRYRYLRA